MHICPTFEAESIEDLYKQLKAYQGDNKIGRISITVDYIHMYVNA